MNARVLTLGLLAAAALGLAWTARGTVLFPLSVFIGCAFIVLAGIEWEEA